MCGKQIVLKYERRAALLQNRGLSSQNAWILQTGDLYEYNLYTHAPWEISCVVFVPHIIWLYQKISQRQFVSAQKNHTYTHSETRCLISTRVANAVGIKSCKNTELRSYTNQFDLVSFDWLKYVARLPASEISPMSLGGELNSAKTICQKIKIK